MIAWTVATPDMMAVAQEASRRICHYGDVESVIFPCEDRFDCHRKKLQIWQELSGPSWFYDADLWMVQKCPLGIPTGEIIIGNPDDCCGAKYDGTFVDPTQAINSSLVGMDMSNTWMKNGVIAQAIRYQIQAFGDSPTQDEKFLNMAAWLPERRTMIARLSTRWNWCDLNPPKDAIAVHAASQFTFNKLEWLNKAVKNYEN